MEIKSNVLLKVLDKYIALKPIDNKDFILFKKLAKTNKTHYELRLKSPFISRTYSQIKTAFKLIEIIFLSQNGRKPTKDEKDNLYEDLKHEYADKRVSFVNPQRLIPIGLSHANIGEASRFVQALINFLASYCDLDLDCQTEVRFLLQEWETYRGDLEHDPLDDIFEDEWRKMHKVSQADGMGGNIQLCHIVSRGRDTFVADKAWNWIALTYEQHMEQHRYGWDWFLKKYPSLKGRVKRARRLAGVLF